MVMAYDSQVTGNNFGLGSEWDMPRHGQDRRREGLVDLRGMYGVSSNEETGLTDLVVGYP